MPRKKWPETKSESVAPVEPQEPEITRVFKEITSKDGTQHVEEQPSVSPPVPKETLVDADNEADE